MPDVENRPKASTWSIRTVLEWAAKDFGQRGFDSPRLDAELLLGHVLGLDRIRLIVDAARPLNSDELGAYRALIQRRRRAEPIAYILGRREFYGLSFSVDRRVLVPRPDTETLVEVALERTRRSGLFGTALDLCSGSGCVAISFHKYRPTWHVTAVDKDPNAVDVARENALRLGTIWSTRFLAGDLDAPLRPDEKFDLVTANPPYIPTAEIDTLEPDIRDHEPRLALDGGHDGFSVIERIVELAIVRLASSGIVAIEVGHDQAARLSTLFQQRGYTEIATHKDYGGHDRVVSARPPPRNALHRDTGTRS